MPSIYRDTYVPILLTRQAEIRSLGDLSSKIANSIVPMFMVHPRDWDYDNDDYKRSVDDHLDRLVKDLSSRWGDREALVDVGHLNDDVTADGEHPLVALIDRAREKNVTLTPVTDADRSPEHQEAVRRVVAGGSELLLRLPASQWKAVTAHRPRLNALLERFAIDPGKVHLLFDLKTETGPAAQSGLKSALSALDHADQWASVTVAGTSMPSSMPPGEGLHRLPRPEWEFYRSLRDGRFPRIPAFSDYGIQHPKLPEVNPAVLQITAHLRYLVENDWIIAKGGLFKGPAGRGEGGKAMIPALKALIADPDYTPNHCACEKWVAQTLDNAESAVNPSKIKAGNALTWRQQGTTRHVTRAAELISSLV